MNGDSTEKAMYVALAAPWGIGKTSVIATLCAEANAVLAGTPVSMQPVGPTRERLNQLNNALRGHLHAGEFIAEGIKGTQGIQDFNLELKAVGYDRQFQIKILDYDGGLIDKQESEEWAQVREFLRRADVLILPIDAAMLMEAVTGRNRRQVQEIHNISEMELLVREWAKSRCHNGNDHGLLALAPVKCESYFADNGGLVDKSNALYERVFATYREVVSSMGQESKNMGVLYCPIDTMGCVEVMRVEWPKFGSARPKMHYRVRGEPSLARKGAADLFVQIVKQMLSEERKRQVDRVRIKEDEAGHARDERDKERNIFEGFWNWITGEQDRLEREAGAKNRDAAAAQGALDRLVAALEQVRKRPMGSRSRMIVS